MDKIKQLKWYLVASINERVRRQVESNINCLMVFLTECFIRKGKVFFL